MSKEEIFDRPLLILCEGYTDLIIVTKLMATYSIGSLFTVKFPSNEYNGTGGVSKFGQYLSDQYATNVSFRENVKSVLIISDSDDDLDASFANVQRALSEADKWPVPPRPQVVAHGRPSDKVPSVTIYMLPESGLGSLETVCLNAAYSKWALESHIDTLVSHTEVLRWPAQKQAKAKLHILLAVTCETKPETNLANVWQENERFHIPLSHSAFDPLVAFLRTFLSSSQTLP